MSQYGLLVDGISLLFFSVRGCPSSLTGYFGVFSSPNYPQNYDNNLRCSWGITVPSGYRVQVTSGSFNTESGFDYLRIYDGPSSSSAQLAALTGPRSTPFVYLSTGTRLWFTFHTDHSVVTSGFQATYTAGMYKHRPGGLSLFRIFLVSVWTHKHSQYCAWRTRLQIVSSQITCERLGSLIFPPPIPLSFPACRKPLFSPAQETQVILLKIYQTS